MKKTVLVAVVLVAMLASVQFASAQVPLTEARCQEKDVKPGEQVPQQDLCSLAQTIVRNRYLWNWWRHYESLCSGVPSYLRSWCEYFACEFSKCSDFRAGSCAVSKGHADGTESDIIITPCPSKYLAFSCLSSYFPKQFAGCLDGLYDRI
eukprot:TRINITY_DN94786_c0_g1_i1.p1 TRINITY_DN94786_c0_g1~~TRINITY_DN94786_c0_g1_i1.p1  ORF type:complete len:161 (-),score=61.00 TRINITY_DN94786_c0_g1_i1:90-539(-)